MLFLKELTVHYDYNSYGGYNMKKYSIEKSEEIFLRICDGEDIDINKIAKRLDYEAIGKHDDAGWFYAVLEEYGADHKWLVKLMDAIT